MKLATIIEFPHDRETKKQEDTGNRRSARKKGRVYSRGGKLWVDFRYLGNRVREPSGLKDTTVNRRALRKQLDLIVAEIDNGIFEFAHRFPSSSNKDYFARLEGKTIQKDPGDVLFGEYYERWWNEMTPGMTVNQIRDYTSALSHHILPYFRKMPFSEFNPVLIKKFVALLRSKKNKAGKPLSPKRIQNVMIPLRVIVKDALCEYGWATLSDPFWGVKIPAARKIRVNPFSFREWKLLMEHMLPWYRPYFEFAVQTGLRPSEQVAIKWAAIDDEFIHIELSRVRNQEKSDMKTTESNRRIAIRPTMARILQEQRKLTAHLKSPYVFINTAGRPILQDKLRETWERVMTKSGLLYRRMYETRHTFASWALAAGEAPEWVARTLGHVNTSMVYKTYGRYIPNLTRQDGSAFELQFATEIAHHRPQNGHNFGHNG